MKGNDGCCDSEWEEAKLEERRARMQASQYHPVVKMQHLNTNLAEGVLLRFLWLM